MQWWTKQQEYFFSVSKVILRKAYTNTQYLYHNARNLFCELNNLYCLCAFWCTFLSAHVSTYFSVSVWDPSAFQLTRAPSFGYFGWGPREITTPLSWVSESSRSNRRPRESSTWVFSTGSDNAGLFFPEQEHGFEIQTGWVKSKSKQSLWDKNFLTFLGFPPFAAGVPLSFGWWHLNGTCLASYLVAWVPHRRFPHQILTSDFTSNIIEVKELTFKSLWIRCSKWSEIRENRNCVLPIYPTLGAKGWQRSP